MQTIAQLEAPPKFNLFNAFRSRYPIDNFEFIEINMRPWGAVQVKSERFILKNLKFLLPFL